MSGEKWCHSSFSRRGKMTSDTIFLLLLAAVASGQTLRIHHLDVGQGDGTLIQGPTGKTMLIDAGEDGAGNAIVAPYLRARGINRLDFLVASHFHSDHLGGLDEVIRSGIPATLVYDRGSFGTLPTTQSYTDYVAAAGAARRTVAVGQVLDLGGGALATCVAVNGFLIGGGSVAITGSSQFENSASVAWKISFGNFQYFTAGDLTGGGNGTADVETQLASRVGNVDAMKLSHHASATSTNTILVAALRPEACFASMGLANPYGHPHQEPLDYCNSAAAATPVYQTSAGTGNQGGIAVNGTIVLETDGTRYTVSGPVLRAASFLCDELAATRPPLAGEARVSEYLANPAAVADAQGEWFELFNTGCREPTLAGCRLRDAGTDSFTLRTTMLLPPMGYLVVGASGNRAVNGGYTPDLVWPRGVFALGNSGDEIILQTGKATTVDSVAYNGSFPIVNGQSSEKANLLGPASGGNFLPSTVVFGAGDRGTPGARNSRDVTNLGPGFVSIAPAFGGAPGGTPATITGCGFVPGATTVRLGGGLPGLVTVVNATTILITTPAAPGYTPKDDTAMPIVVDLILTTPAGTTLVPGAFVYY